MSVNLLLFFCFVFGKICFTDVCYFGAKFNLAFSHLCMFWATELSGCTTTGLLYTPPTQKRINTMRIAERCDSVLGYHVQI